MTNRPYVLAGGALGLGYVSAAIRRIDRPVTASSCAFIEREQMQKLKAILTSVLSLKRVERFQVTSR